MCRVLIPCRYIGAGTASYASKLSVTDSERTLLGVCILGLPRVTFPFSGNDMQLYTRSQEHRFVENYEVPLSAVISQ